MPTLPPLNHVDLFHQYFWTRDVEGSMAVLGERFGLTWSRLNHGRFSFRDRRDGRDPGEWHELEVTWTFSRQGPPYIELGHVAFSGMPGETDLVNPHHYGYWCDDLAGTRDALVAQGWTFEFEVQGTRRQPSEAGVSSPDVPFVRSPRGHLLELVPRDGKAGFLARQGL